MRDAILSKDELNGLKELAKRAVEILLKENLQKVAFNETPILLVGATYTGTWLEHNQDALLLAPIAPKTAWATVEAFMQRQRADGLLPFCLPKGGVDHPYFKAEAVYWQVQTVFPFVRCAMEVADIAGRPQEDYRRIYEAGCRYDAWFRAHRDNARTGLVEMCCEYDTGHDNSPRVTDGGIPHSCPDNDANNMPVLPCMPLIAADLSATRYGDRMALVQLAEHLGLMNEAAQWKADAAALKAQMKALLYDPETDFYYDRSPQGLRKYRTEHITRLFLNRLFDQEEFDRLYDRHFRNPAEFDTPFPYPAVAADDPSFVKTCPVNCWGANAQANTAERAIFWLKDYHREDELDRLLAEWARVLVASNGNFGQEVNPFTREILPSGGKYSPSLLICIEAAKRLCGYEPPKSAL